MSDKRDIKFNVPLPGGRVARVPLSVLEEYVAPDATVAHGAATVAPPPKTQREPGHFVIHIWTHRAGAGASEADDAGVVVPLIEDLTAPSTDRTPTERPPDDGDVSAHHVTLDGATGVSDWHLDYECGDCIAADPATGSLTTFRDVWHNHPYGTEYAELYEG